MAIVIATALVVVIAVSGLMAHAAGYGFLGYRLAAYGEASLYVLNLSEEPRRVSVDGRTAETVDADSAQLLRLVGGLSTVEVFDEADQRLQSFEVETDRSHAFLNLSGETCLVVSQLSNVTTDEELSVEIVDMLGPRDDLYVMETDNVVWPRGYPGVLTDDGPPARSIEAIDCWLLEEKDFLKDYLQSRFTERL